MEIVYCFIGKLPAYIIETVFQAYLFFPGKKTLITDDVNSPYLQNLSNYNLHVVNALNFQDTKFNQTIQENLQKFCIAPHLGDRHLLFIRCFQRFFLLKNYMKEYSLTNVLFLELDVMIYKNPDDLLDILKKKEMTVSYVVNRSVCTGYCYIRDRKILEDITEYFLKFIQNSQGISNDHINEMAALGHWLETPANRERVWMLPGLWKEPKYVEDVWTSFHDFNQVLFDGAGIAINVDGPDKSHLAEWERRGKVWWGTDVQYSDYSYEWKDINGLRVLHLINEEKQAFPVYCLHVHNKNLHAFLSKPMDPKNKGNSFYDHNFLHGNKFLHFAHLVLRSKKRSDYYPVEHWNPSKCFFFEDIPELWNNPSLLYCNTDDVRFLIPNLYKIQNKFILITHNSDENVTSKYLDLILCPKLVHWFTQNLCDILPKTSPLPIGIANPTWPHGNPIFFEIIKKQPIEKNNILYANFLISTNPTIRQPCADSLREKNVPFHPHVHPFQNLINTASSYFTICPEGNGKDTHRFWESLFCKSIPIVIRSTFTEQLQKEGYPCILLKSWNELSPEILSYSPQVFSSELETKLGYSYYEEKIKDCLKTFM